MHEPRKQLAGKFGLLLAFACTASSSADPVAVKAFAPLGKANKDPGPHPFSMGLLLRHQHKTDKKHNPRSREFVSLPPEHVSECEVYGVAFSLTPSLFPWITF